MPYLLDKPVPTLNVDDDEIVELNGADILEEIKEDITNKVEIFPELAHYLEEAVRGAIVHALGAALDAAILIGIDPDLRGPILTKSIELLKERKIYDLGKF
jgi:hypothetical protein